MKWNNLAGYYKKNSVFACLPSNFSLRQLSKTCVGFAPKTDKLYDRTEADLSVSKRRSWSARPSCWEFLIVRHLLVQFFSFLGTVFHQSERTYLLNIWPLETFISSRLLIKKHRLLYIVIVSLTPCFPNTNQIWLPKTCRKNPLSLYLTTKQVFCQNKYVESLSTLHTRIHTDSLAPKGRSCKTYPWS